MSERLATEVSERQVRDLESPPGASGRATDGLTVNGSVRPEGNLTRKASLNALASALDYGARLITNFFITPFLLAGLGTALFGTWKTLENLTGYISVASTRYSQALRYTVANLQDSDDIEEKQRYIASALIAWVVFLPILATLGGVLAWFAPNYIKGLAPAHYALVRIATIVLVTNLILNTLSDIPQSVLAGQNLAYKRMGVSAVLVFFGAGLAILALYLKLGLIGLGVAELITTIITGIFYFVIVRTYVPWFGYARPTATIVKRFIGLSGWFLAWRLVLQLTTASDLTILGLFASIQLVTTYTITKYASEALTNFISFIVVGSSSGLGGLIGAQEYERAARIRGEIMRLTWLISMTLGATIILWNEEFVQLWVGQGRYAGSSSNVLILCLVVQFVLIRNDAIAIDLTLDVSRKVLLGLLSAFLSVAIALVLVVYLDGGIEGMVFGLILGRMVLTVAYPILIGRTLGQSVMSQFRGLLRPALVTGILVMSVIILDQYLLGRGISPASWLMLILFSGITCLLMMSASFFLGLNRQQQASIYKRLRSVVNQTDRW